ncbi:MAG TPA: acetate/propionate family kinase [Chthoniobacterales bacterium]|nr:acetate/propionate family kinase [Chthoniobacterales bacterium]
MDLPGFLKERVGIFKDFSADRIQQLVEGSRTRSFEANEAIAHQGAEATHFGVILSGTVAASVQSDGTRQFLGELKAADTFGEAALMTGNPLLADFVAESPSEVLLIPVSLFQSIIVSEPGAVRHISRTIAERTKMLMAEPAKAAATFRPDEDPYGLTLKGERPEKILVINCGSSSLKYSFYDTIDESRQAKGQIDRIGLTGTNLKHRAPKGEVKRELPQGDHAAAFKAMIAELTSKENGVIGGAAEVSIVAHRVVHGGEKFTEGSILTDELLAEMEKLNPLAPLHNPVIVAGIREMRKLFPAVPHVGVFDTAFHHTLPAYAFLYGLPYEFYEKKAIRRYGFHGTSHHYVSLRAAQFLKKRPNELQIVSCHLGNGSSLCAVDHGRSIDTTMGFTPIEGLIMGTRCGDLDPGVVAFLERNDNLSASQTEEILNKKSGLLGLSGISSDMREVLKAADEGNHHALLALKAYCYRVRKYIGAYVASMGGLDAVVFTGGVGQGSKAVRALALQGLDCMGIKLGDQRNREARADEISLVSSADSNVAVLVVPTDEERMIAREAIRAISRSYITRVLETQKQKPFLVEVSAHHIHLTQEHVEALFGQGHQLTKHSDLSQPGQYACKEQLTIIGPKGRVERVRILGPARKYTQVEIAMTEQFKLGVYPPIRESGDIANTPGCILEGAAGKVELDRGVICALRHIHMTPEDALRYGVRDKSVVRVRIAGDRELVFGDVLVRVDPNFALAMHIDTDEANAAHIGAKGAEGYIDAIQKETN